MLTNTMPLCILLLIFHIFLSGILRNRIARASGKKGENRVNHILKIHGYHVFNDVMLKINGKSVQIDHIAVSRHALLIIETKNHHGLINGSAYEKTWTQTFPNGNVYTFYNPVWQNYGHQKAITGLLGVSQAVVPIVVFASDPCLDVTISNMPVVRAHGLPTLLRMINRWPPSFTKNEFQRLCDRIKELNVNSYTENKRHIKYVKSVKELQFYNK